MQRTSKPRGCKFRRRRRIIQALNFEIHRLDPVGRSLETSRNEVAKTLSLGRRRLRAESGPVVTSCELRAPSGLPF